jgi:hypothetical protein
MDSIAPQIESLCRWPYVKTNSFLMRICLRTAGHSGECDATFDPVDEQAEHH